MPGTYGVPQYFQPMINDSDRLCQFVDAMMRCLTDLMHLDVTSLLVLDFGAGTGILSEMLHKIAKKLKMKVHTVLVDTNSDELEMARAVLTEQGLQENINYDPKNPAFPHDFTIHHGSCSKLHRNTVVFNQMVDMVVSEILGTFASSESIVQYYFVNVMPLVKTIGDKKHAIPCAITQYASLYSDSIFIPTAPSNDTATLLDTDDTLTRHSRLMNRCKAPEGHIRVMNGLITKPEATPSCIVPIYAAGHREGKFWYMETKTKDIFGPVTIDKHCILVFPWKATLYEDHSQYKTVLSNTPKRTNPARQQAWGTAFCYLLPDGVDKLMTGSVNVSWPKTSIQPVGAKFILPEGASKEDLHIMKKNKSIEILASSDDDDNDDDSDYEEESKKKKGKKPVKRVKRS